MFKNLTLVPVVFLSLITGCIKPEDKVKSADQETVIVSNNLCENSRSYSSLVLTLNSDSISKQEDQRNSIFSGGAVKLIAKLSNSLFAKSIDKYSGLVAPCELSGQILNLSCEGNIEITDNENKIKSLTFDQLVQMHDAYFRKITLCGSITMEKDQTLFLQGAEISFDNLSVKLSDQSLLSLSADKLIGGDKLNGVTKDAESSFSIHAIE